MKAGDRVVRHSRLFGLCAGTLEKIEGGLAYVWFDRLGRVGVVPAEEVFPHA